tara:strand:- start:239325 stop:239870 length:546 start_codon:yes stop_codon:yes gene_type:complete
MGISSATWPLFGVIWPSSEVLANLMQSYPIEDLSILELGCGIGLSSIILNQRNANITSSDHHPDAGTFLKENLKLNNFREIEFIRADWDDEENSLEKYDLIIGSDLLYQPDHIMTLSRIIQNAANPKCVVIIVDPGRGNSNKFTKEMEKYNFVLTEELCSFTTNSKQDYKGKILTYTRSIL